jgi:hypothetical protein
MMVYEYDDQILVVDTGDDVPENDMLGIDYLYLISPTSFSTATKSRVNIITHGHEGPHRCHPPTFWRKYRLLLCHPAHQGLLEVNWQRMGWLHAHTP